MATIVQPYNPWREQLAFNALGNIAGNILGDIWARHKQSEENKKINAFRGQLQQDLQNNAGNNVSLTQPTPPDGYDSNPWGNALHQKYSPLTQFDIGTGGIGKVPSIQDIAQGVDRLAATPRFSMLGQEAVGKVRNDFLQRAYADMFANAPDRAGQYNAITQAVLGGNAPWQAMNSLGTVYMYENPYKQLVQTDLGSTKRVDSFDQLTGVITPGTSFNVGINPTQQYVADSSANASRDVANIHALASTSNARTAADAQRLNYQIEYGQKYYDSLQEKYNQALQNMPSDEAAARVYQETILNPLRAQLDDAEANLRNLLQGAGNSQQRTQGATYDSNFGDLSYWGDTSNGKSKYGDFSTFINKYAKEHNIDPDLAAAVMNWESGGNPNAISSQGAIGLFQLMPDTAKSLGVDPHNVEQNIKGGIMYLRQMLDKYNNNLELALRAYNAGPGATDAGRYPDETKKYVPGVLGIYRKYRSSRPQKKTNPAQQTPAQGNTPPVQPTQPTPERSTTAQKTPVKVWLNELDPLAYIQTSDGNSYTKEEIEAIAKNQGKTLQQWIQDNNVQPFPDFRSYGNPRDPVAYMSDRSGNYFTQDEIQREAARRNLTLGDYENQLRAQGYRKAGEGFPEDTDSGFSWSSFNIHAPILSGGRTIQPLPSQENVSGDTRFNPIFTGNAADNFMQGFSALGLTQGDDTAVIPRTFFEENINLTPNDPRYSANVSVSIPSGEGYNPQPAPFPNNYMDRNRRNLNPYLNTGYSRGGVQSAWSLADFLNRFRNSENPLGRNFQALGSDPRNPPHYYLPGNVWQGLTPNPFSELIDGEYIFLDPNMYWR